MDNTREIKFRAWLGNYNVNEMVDVLRIDFKDNYLVPYPGDQGCFDLRDTPLMQYTGLKDKNGTEIYEGDVCNARMIENESIFKYYKMEVVWNEEKAGFYFKDDEGEWTITHTPIDHQSHLV